MKNESITSQEGKILKIVKDRKGGISVDELYRRIYSERIITRDWIIKNALRRLVSFKLITINDFRAYSTARDDDD